MEEKKINNLIATISISGGGVMLYSIFARLIEMGKEVCYLAGGLLVSVFLIGLGISKLKF